MLYVLNFINTILSARFEVGDCNPRVECEKPVSVGGLIRDIKEEMDSLVDFCKPLFRKLSDRESEPIFLCLCRAKKHTEIFCDYVDITKNGMDLTEKECHGAEDIHKVTEKALEDLQMCLMNTNDIASVRPVAVVRLVRRNVDKLAKML